MTITIEAATAERFGDAEHALTGGGDGGPCQCQWWMMTNAQWRSTSVEERTEMLRQELGGAPHPALIAYVDGEAAGWVRVGPRPAQVRIARTREIVANTTEPLDDPSVWSVSCFVIRKEHRGRGLHAKLLDAAVAYAREQGARVVEAYPVDPTAAKKSSNELYRGVVSVFEAAGFDVVARPRPDRALVSLTLQN